MSDKKRYGFEAENDFMQQVSRKRGLLGLSALIRELLRMWVAGEIEVKMGDSSL